MAKQPSKSLLHAQHNDAAIKYLDKSPDHLDWVITICFYSSLHYIRHHLFPKTEKTDDGKSFKIKTFDEYHRHFKRMDDLSKHERLLNLTFDNCSEIASDYNTLMDLCSTARYSDYTADRDLSNKAKQLHKNIKLFCNPPEVINQSRDK